MTKKYRFYSDSFGEHLEKMATGLIAEFISYVNNYASTKNYSAYFNVGWISKDWKTENHYLVITVYEGTTMQKIVECLNKAYVNFFAFSNYDNEYKNINISITIDGYSWDKHGLSYLRVMRVHDTHFYKYHEDARKLHL